MDYYVDIRILPDPESSDNVLMSQLFVCFHDQLARFGFGEIGISFPQFGRSLGALFRMHGAKATLERFMSVDWIKGLKNYLVVSDISHVPESVGYRVVKRVQSKSSPARLMRRSVRKGWISQKEADTKIRDTVEKRLLLPYLRVKSRSTAQFFHLFVDHGPVVSTPRAGVFSAYGLSSDATVPWF